MANEAPDPPGVTTSERLWSEECAIADAADGQADRDPNKMPGYEFSNGRNFNSGNGDYDVPGA